MSVNKVILIGRLGQNPEIRQTPSGAAVANFSVATNDAWTDKSGQKQERTEWHRVVVWGKLAELCGQYLVKGRQVFLEGKLQTRQWQDKDGQTKYTTEILAQTVQFLGGNAQAGAGAGMGAGMSAGPSMGGYGNASSGFGAGVSSMSMDSGRMEEPSFTEDDIPF